MRYFSEHRVTAALFTGFLVAGVTAVAAAFLILGRMIVMAGDVPNGPLYVVASGGLVGILTTFVIHEVGMVLPGVMARLNRI
jgi:ABC-type Mn2+/Zn2+ transport system permease subunit